MKYSFKNQHNSGYLQSWEVWKIVSISDNTLSDVLKSNTKIMPIAVQLICFLVQYQNIIEDLHPKSSINPHTK